MEEEHIEQIPKQKNPGKIKTFIFSTFLFLEHTLFIFPKEYLKKHFGRKTFNSIMYSPKAWWALFLLAMIADGAIYKLEHWKYFLAMFIVLMIIHRLVAGDWKYWARQRGYKI